jgi:hypothetical protein
MFREDDIVVLLGAGCSVEAGIPDSKSMIEKLEELVGGHTDWGPYKYIYYFMKSSIFYSDGILGKFSNGFDIERLVNVLSELEKRENSILYPFIGSWNQRLIALAGYRFDIIQDFKKMILNQLKSWVSLENYQSSTYYKKLYDFQSEYNYSLRVFSLNYDLCVEKNRPGDKDLERGFDKDTRVWDWKRFEPREEYQPSIYLYKMHGSIDWKRDVREGNMITEVENIPEVPDLIFGTDYKMQYIDPYLFYAYELRKYSLESQVIVAIGYSFRDEHINGIIEQSLQNRPDRKIIVVSPDSAKIPSKFPKTQTQFISQEKGAREFLNNLSVDRLRGLLEDSGE